ncbi:MAG TPA: NADH-quinone oxidoreductase subunit N, partial [Nitrospira sp.]|nr:NADH-quinone oxidoreductase subunit N [Nitrospira sp.]
MTSFGPDLLVILPELIVIGAACLILVLDPLTEAPKKEWLAWISLGALALCIGLTGGQIGMLNLRVFAFNDLVVVDAYARFWKLLLYVVTGLTILMSMPYLKVERLHLGEYYGFMLLSLSGMLVMVSGADLLTIYLGTELMSLSLYVMAGLKRSSPRSLEASAKYFVLGAFSSGLLLYGISLLYGATGGTKLAAIANAIGTRGFEDPLLMIATVLLTVGFGFKLAVVPFHMWTPDVYQGAPTSVTAFMAVASKAASFAAFLRVFVEGLGGLKADWSGLFIALCVATLILGNVVAIVQTNIKRMLAYSSIAHAGYALIGVVAAARGAG